MEKGKARKERGGKAWGPKDGKKGRCGRKRIKNKEMEREKEVNTNKDDA